MSTQIISSLVEAIQKDHALRAKVSAAQTFPEIASILGQAGYQVSPSELEAGCGTDYSKSEAELTEAELEKAAGGKGTKVPAGRLFLHCATGVHFKEAKLI